MNTDWRSHVCTRMWDETAAIYSEAALTREWPEETNTLKQMALRLRPEAIQSFGTASGCRDPKVALMVLEALGHRLDLVRCNDLSPALLEVAQKEMAPFQYLARRWSFEPGPIHLLPRAPGTERLASEIFIGAYRVPQLIAGGLQTYHDNADLLGESFSISALYLSDHGPALELLLPGIAAPELAGHISAIVAEMKLQAHSQTPGEGCQLIGFNVRAEKPEELFNSTWFTRSGIRALIERAFPQSFFQYSVHAKGKGFLCRIQPRLKDRRGMITLMNNVVGNILPENLMESLAKLQAWARPVPALP